MAKRMQYGEDTVVMRIPKSMVSEVKNMLESRKVIESINVDVSKEHPVVAQILDTFMALCAQQMGGVIASLEHDANASGDIKKIEALQAMKPYFSDMAGTGAAGGGLFLSNEVKAKEKEF